MESLPYSYKVKQQAGNPPYIKGEGRLDGWEEIASFLSRGIRTVRRWEKDLALPVRRLSKLRRSRVHAYRKELTHWMKAQEQHPLLPAFFKDDPKFDGTPHVGAPRDVLTSWKNIAAFLGRSVRTVQRREQEMGLPIRRHKSEGRGFPYALRSELAQWLKEYRLPTGSTGSGRPGMEPLHLLKTMIDGWSAFIVVLNERGNIFAVNRAWQTETHGHGSRSTYCGIGMNYVDVCNSLSRAKSGPTPTAIGGITDLLKGVRQSLQLRYRANTPTDKRWFLLQSARFDLRGAACLVLIHSDVTELLGDGIPLKACPSAKS